MADRRFAMVTNPTALDTVKRYMPSNYEADVLVDGTVVISGEDSRGWTLDDYVLPRLASGNIRAVELLPKGP